MILLRTLNNVAIFSAALITFNLLSPLTHAMDGLASRPGDQNKEYLRAYNEKESPKWLDQMDLLLVEMMASKDSVNCFGCKLAMEDIERLTAEFSSYGSEVTSDQVALQIFERFDVLMMNVVRPLHVFTNADGRFYYAYLQKLFRGVMKGHLFKDHQELAHRVFASENSGLKCELMAALKLDDEDVSWLMDQAVMKKNVSIRSCLVRWVLPQLHSGLQTTFVTRLWNSSTPIERVKIAYAFAKVTQQISVVDSSHAPLIRWMIRQKNPHLDFAIMKLAKTPGTEQNPDLVRHLFEVAGVNNTDLLTHFGPRLCQPQLRFILERLVNEGAFWQNTVLVQKTLIAEACYKDQALLEMFIANAENYTLLALAESVLPLVENQRLMAKAILAKTDWQSHAGDEVIVSVFSQLAGPKAMDLLKAQLGRLYQLDSVRAEEMRNKILQLAAWQSHQALLRQDLFCEPILMSARTPTL